MKANAINLDTTNVKLEPRWEWAEAAQQMQAEEDDKSLMDDLPSDFEKEQWTW
jgi:hypothetical protein